jgi:uncharacterized protein YbgA (DUF1722 family)
MAQRNGTGMFPREVMKRFPLLPLEEEGRLNDMPLRENFIERVFAYYRWTEMLDKEPTPGGLVKFHTAHKLTLMAHSPKHYTQMGRLVSDAGKRDWDELAAEYGTVFMEGLGVTGTRGKHVNVLQHLMGYLKNHLSSDDKQQLLSLIEDYRKVRHRSYRTLGVVLGRSPTPATELGQHAARISTRHFNGRAQRGAGGSSSLQADSGALCEPAYVALRR